MPGSSLWLVPPPSHPLHGILNTLVSTTLPARFPRESASSPAVAPHFFAVHMTLTSEIDPARYGSDPQAWLDSIPWPSSSSSSSSPGRGGGGGVRVRFERVDTQDVFFRRCFIRVRFDGVREVAGLAREYGVVKGGNEGEEGTKKLLFSKETEEWLDWWRAEYGPHVSLIYGDVPMEDEVMKQVAKVVREAGVKLPQDSAGETEDGSQLDGWDGGVVWLVPTDRPVSEWKPIATRVL